MTASATATPPRAGSHWRLLRRNRDFRLLWVGFAASELGSSISALAVPMLVFATTGSATVAGTLGTAIFITRWALAIPGGHVADAVPPQGLMIACDLVSATLMAAVAGWLLVGPPPMWLLITAAVGCAGVSVAFGPAAGKLMRRVVPAPQLPEAAATASVRSFGVQLAGPALAGILFAAHRALPFVADAVSYVVSAACVARLRPGPGSVAGQVVEAAPGPRPDAGRTGVRPSRRWRAEMAVGWRTLWREPVLRGITAYSTVTNFVTSALVFVVLLAGYGDAHYVGMAVSCASLAALAGSLAAPAVQRRYGLRTVLAAVSLTRVAAIAAAALIGGPASLAVALVAVLGTGPIANVAIATLQMILVPEEIFGRVSGVISFLAVTLQPLAPLAAGLLIDHASTPASLGVLDGAFAIVAAGVLLMPHSPAGGTLR